MGSYYDFFKSDSIDEEVHWSVPYYDAIGDMGLVITASAAVVVDGKIYKECSHNLLEFSIRLIQYIFSPGELRGVVGADISMRELLADVTYFKANSDRAYSFIIDQHFRTLAHPFLPSPSSIDSDPVFVNISMLERRYANKDICYCIFFL